MDNISLSYSRYNCTYHLVFIPKYRRKEMLGELRREVGEAVHMFVSIPPKESVSKIAGRIKGKSSLILFDRHPECRDRYNRHFWARGYYCETIGNVNETTISKFW